MKKLLILALSFASISAFASGEKAKLLSEMKKFNGMVGTLSIQVGNDNTISTFVEYDALGKPVLDENGNPKASKVPCKVVYQEASGQQNNKFPTLRIVPSRFLTGVLDPSLEPRGRKDFFPEYSVLNASIAHSSYSVGHSDGQNSPALLNVFRTSLTKKKNSALIAENYYENGLCNEMDNGDVRSINDTITFSTGKTDRYVIIDKQGTCGRGWAELFKPVAGHKDILPRPVFLIRLPVQKENRAITFLAVVSKSFDLVTTALFF